jgi:hypothetical protein
MGQRIAVQEQKRGPLPPVRRSMATPFASIRLCSKPSNIAFPDLLDVHRRSRRRITFANCRLLTPAAAPF